MKILKWLGIGAFAIVLIVAVIGFCLPRKFHVERGIAINAPPEAIHAVVAKLREWPTWTAWTVERYPDMKIAFSGPEEGVGAKQTWEGKTSGNGSIEIKKSDPQEGIEYEFAFDGHPSTGAIKFLPGPDSTLVYWSSEGDMGLNPIGRYFGMLMDGMMGPDFEKGLANLKRKVEAANDKSLKGQFDAAIPEAVSP
jgi:hypothetical protein